MTDQSKRVAPRLRWLAGEGVVVMLGVLGALSVDSCQDRAHKREQQAFYMEQIVEDLRGSENDITNTLSIMDAVLMSTSAILRAYQDPGHTPHDSMTAWLLRIPSGMYRASLNTVVIDGLARGELAVLDNDSLRILLPGLVGTTQWFNQAQGEFAQDYRFYWSQLARKLTGATLAKGHLERSPTDSVSFRHLPFKPEFAAAFPTDYDHFLRDREAYWAIDGLYEVCNSMSYMLRDVRARVSAARATLEGELVRTRD